MDFDVSLDAGAGAFEVAEALELIADKLVVGRALQRQKALEEGVNFRRPDSVMVAATGAGLEGFWINEPGGAKLIKAGFADSEEAGGGGGILAARVEIRKDAQDEIRGEAVSNLFFFKTEASIGEEDLRDAEIKARSRGGWLTHPWGLCVGLRSAPASSEAPGMGKPKERVSVQNRIPLLLRLSSLLNRLRSLLFRPRQARKYLAECRSGSVDHIRSVVSIPKISSPCFKTRPANSHKASRDARSCASALSTGQFS